MSIIKNIVVFYLILFTSESTAQWELRYPDFPSDNINDIVFINEQKGFIVNDGGSVLITTDGGLSWDIKAHYQRNTFAEIKFVDELNGFSFSPHGYIGDDVQFIFTTDGGTSWEKASVNLSNALTFLPISTSMLLKSVDDGTIMKLDNFYGNWMETFRVPYFFDQDIMVPYGFINQYQKFDDGKIFALGSSWVARDHYIISDSVSYILKSLDNGTSWDTLWCDLNIAANTFFFMDSLTGWFGGEKNYIYKTTDGGASWTYQFSDTLLENKITGIYATNGQDIFAVNEIGTVYSSNDGGINWTAYQLPDSYWWKFTIKFINDQKGFITGTDFWVTTDGGNSWNRVSDCIKDDIWEVDFVDLNTGWASGTNGIYKTSDGGYNWELQLNSPGYFYSIDMIDSLTGWATSDLLHKTTDGGQTWDSLSLGNTIGMIRGVHFLDHNVGIIYEVWDWSVDSTINFVTTDGGNIWTRYTIQNYQYVTSFSKMKFTDPEHLWFVNQQGVWLSQDTGKTWTLNETINSQFGVFDFLNSQTCWLQEEHENIAFTTDGGNFWERMDTPYDVQGIDMNIIGRDYFGNLYTLLCGFYGSLIEFIEEPTYGTYINSSYTQNSLNSISKYISGYYADIWVAGNGFTILYRKEFVSSIPSDNNSQVNEFKLDQNYPNPFNPTTNIGFRIADFGFVTLKVYDVLGNEIATLVSEEKPAGKYEVEFSPETIIKQPASGIYFYQLKSGNFVETKKMILLK